MHSGHRALHKLLTDHGRPDLFGQPYMDVTIARSGTRIQGYPNYLTKEQAQVDPGIVLHAAFTVSELLRNGVTTFVELGGHVIVQEALWKQCEALGVRGYLGPGYDSGRWASDDDGNLTRVPYPDGGLHLFNDAVAFIERVERDPSDRVHGILVPREVENCSVDILRRTVAAARDLGVPMATHAGYNVIEFYETVREHRKTPIELLDSVEMLTPALNIGHANFISDSPRLNYSGGSDLRRMGKNQVSVSHCPINIVRRARVLDSWKSYREAGVNMTIGSDTYPRDMIMNMRTASYHGKVMSHDLTAASAEQVFEAATLGARGRWAATTWGGWRRAPGRTSSPSISAARTCCAMGRSGTRYAAWSSAAWATTWTWSSPVARSACATAVFPMSTWAACGPRPRPSRRKCGARSRIGTRCGAPPG